MGPTTPRPALRLPFHAVDALEAVCTFAAADRQGSLEDAAGLERTLGPLAYSGARTHDDAEARAVRDGLPRLLTLWDADRDAAAALANELLGEVGTVQQLVRHDDLDWHVHAVDASSSLADRIAAETAIAVMDLVLADETSRRKRCAAPDCGLPFLDLSRNRSRRFCSTACQARVNVAAFRERQRAGRARG